MEQNLTKEAAIAKFRELVSNVSVCMFTTVDDRGRLFSRPMTTARIDDDGNAWFFTNEYSEKIQDLSADNKVHLIYSHPVKNVYVTVKGTCSVVLNRKKIDELWDPILKAWFPEGKEDPRLCLLKVVTEEADYWNSGAGKMGVYFKMLRAIANKEKYSDQDSGKLKL